LCLDLCQGMQKLTFWVYWLSIFQFTPLEDFLLAPMCSIKRETLWADLLRVSLKAKILPKLGIEPETSGTLSTKLSLRQSFFRMKPKGLPELGQSVSLPTTATQHDHRLYRDTETPYRLPRLYSQASNPTYAREDILFTPEVHQIRQWVVPPSSRSWVGVYSISYMMSIWYTDADGDYGVPLLCN